MNILLISPYFEPMVGGVETHLDDLCNLFNERKHTVYIRTYKAFGAKFRGLSNEENHNIHIHRLWWPDFDLIYKLDRYPLIKFLYLFPGLFLDCVVFLARKKRSIEVIQAHGFIAAFIAVILGKLSSKRVIVNTHVGFKLKQGLMTSTIKWTLFNCKKILVLTNEIKRYLIEWGIPENRIEVYHYWVDQQKFKKLKNAKRRLGWENKFIVLFVGRLIKAKGVDKILNLAKILKHIKFAIIGSGPLYRELNMVSSDYKNVEFIGKIDNKALPLYYSAADVLLIPSNIIKQGYEEGIPRVMIEALSCRLPIISTMSGGVPGVLTDRVGLLVNDNIESMVRAIEKVFYKRWMPRNVRNYSSKIFSIKNAKIIESSLLSMNLMSKK